MAVGWQQVKDIRAPGWNQTKKLHNSSCMLSPMTITNCPTSTVEYSTTATYYVVPGSNDYPWCQEIMNQGSQFLTLILSV